MLLTKEKKVISIFFVFLDFIEILKSYKCAVSINPPAACCCCSHVCAHSCSLFVVDTEVGVEEEEFGNCTVKRAVATVQQWILNSSHFNSSSNRLQIAFKSPSNQKPNLKPNQKPNRLQIVINRLQIRLQNQKPNRNQIRNQIRNQLAFNLAFNLAFISPSNPKPNQKPKSETKSETKIHL